MLETATADRSSLVGSFIMTLNIPSSGVPAAGAALPSHKSLSDNGLDDVERTTSTGVDSARPPHCGEMAGRCLAGHGAVDLHRADRCGGRNERGVPGGALIRAAHRNRSGGLGQVGRAIGRGSYLS